MRQTVAVGVIKSVEKTDGSKGSVFDSSKSQVLANGLFVCSKVTKSAEKASKK